MKLKYLFLFLIIQSILSSKESQNENNQKEKIIKFCNYISKTNEPKFLIFNRLMKCGSSTMNSIISKLQLNHLQNNKESFYFHSYNGIEWRRTSSKKLYEQLNNLLKQSNYSKMMIEGHFEWKSFDNLPDRSLEYIQLIRNCADRHTSNFFYRLPSHGKVIEPNLLKCLLDQNCLEQYDDLRYMTPDDYSLTFCGIPCTAHQAIQQVQPELGKFLLVGLLEYFIEYLELLECFYPTYFNNVLKLPNLNKIRENISGGSNHTQSSIVKKFIQTKCQNSQDDIVYNELKDLFLKQYQYISKNKQKCCRHSSLL